jgi:hypothetical protein
LKIPLMPTRSGIAVLDDGAEQAIAEEFQARMLGFRLRRLQNGHVPKLDFGDLTSPGQDLARALDGAFAGDTRIMPLLMPLLQAQDGQLRIDRANTIDSILIEALLASDHEGQSREIRSQEYAERVNLIFRGRGAE